jgi:hypothetical protein
VCQCRRLRRKVMAAVCHRVILEISFESDQLPLFHAQYRLTDMSNGAKFTSQLQLWCLDAENVPFQQQRNAIYAEFSVLSSVFLLTCVCAIFCLYGRQIFLSNTTPQTFFKAFLSPTTLCKLFLYLAAVGSAAGVASWMCNMFALVYNIDFFELARKHPTHAAESLSRALVLSAAFDVIYAVEFWCLTFAKLLAFEYTHAIKQELLSRVKFTIDGKHKMWFFICLSVVFICNCGGVICRVLAAWKASDASKNDIFSPHLQLADDFNSSRKYASYQLIFECVSLLAIVLYITLHLFNAFKSQERLDASARLLNADSDAATKKSSAHTACRWPQFAVGFVAITFCIRFCFTLLYTISSMSSLDDNCRDPCGSCQSFFAQIWSYSVFAPHARFACLLMSEPGVVLVVLFCLKKLERLQCNCSLEP